MLRELFPPHLALALEHITNTKGLNDSKEEGSVGRGPEDEDRDNFVQLMQTTDHT